MAPTLTFWPASFPTGGRSQSKLEGLKKGLTSLDPAAVVSVFVVCRESRLAKGIFA